MRTTINHQAILLSFYFLFSSTTVNLVDVIQCRSALLKLQPSLRRSIVRTNNENQYGCSTVKSLSYVVQLKPYYVSDIYVWRRIICMNRTASMVDFLAPDLYNKFTSLHVQIHTRYALRLSYILSTIQSAMLICLLVAKQNVFDTFFCCCCCCYNFYMRIRPNDLLI